MTLNLSIDNLVDNLRGFIEHCDGHADGHLSEFRQELLKAQQTIEAHDAGTLNIVPKEQGHRP
jgi:hypothetical protein